MARQALTLTMRTDIDRYPTIHQRFRHGSSVIITKL